MRTKPESSRKVKLRFPDKAPEWNRRKEEYDASQKLKNINYNLEELEYHISTLYEDLSDMDKITARGEYLDERGVFDNKSEIWRYIEKPYKYDTDFEECLGDNLLEVSEDFERYKNKYLAKPDEIKKITIRINVISQKLLGEDYYDLKGKRI